MEKSPENNETRLSQENTISDDPAKSETDVAHGDATETASENVPATPDAMVPEYEFVTGTCIASLSLLLY